MQAASNDEFVPRKPYRKRYAVVGMAIAPALAVLLFVVARWSCSMFGISRGLLRGLLEADGARAASLSLVVVIPWSLACVFGASSLVRKSKWLGMASLVTGAIAAVPMVPSIAIDLFFLVAFGRVHRDC